MPSSGVSMLNETKGIPDPQTLRKSENRHTEIEDILFLWKFVSKDVTTAGKEGRIPYPKSLEKLRRINVLQQNQIPSLKKGRKTA